MGLLPLAVHKFFPLPKSSTWLCGRFVCKRKSWTCAKLLPYHTHPRRAPHVGSLVSSIEPCIITEETWAEFVSPHPKSQGRPQSPYSWGAADPTGHHRGRGVCTHGATRKVDWATQQPPRPLLQSSLIPPQPPSPELNPSAPSTQQKSNENPEVHLSFSPFLKSHLHPPPCSPPQSSFQRLSEKVEDKSFNPHTSFNSPLARLPGNINPPCSPCGLSCQPGSLL